MFIAASLPATIAVLFGIVIGLTLLTIWYWRASDPSRQSTLPADVAMVSASEFGSDPLGRVDIDITDAPPALALRSVTETVEVDTARWLEENAASIIVPPSLLSSRADGVWPVAPNVGELPITDLDATNAELVGVDSEPAPDYVEAYEGFDSKVLDTQYVEFDSNEGGSVEPVTSVAESELEFPDGSEPISEEDDDVIDVASIEVAAAVSREPLITDSQFFEGISLQEWSAVVGSAVASLPSVDSEDADADGSLRSVDTAAGR